MNNSGLRFLYTGPSLEAVLDMFPTGHIVRRTEEGVEVSAEVEYSRGTIMMLLSQGSWIKILGPKNILGDMKEEVERIAEVYS